MIKLNYKGFIIVAEFNNYDIRNNFNYLEAENIKTVKECKKLIDTWI